MGAVLGALREEVTLGTGLDATASEADLSELMLRAGCSLLLLHKKWSYI